MSNFHETAARKFDLNAIEAWAKYGHTGDVRHKETAEWHDRAAAKNREQIAAVAVVAKPVAVVQPGEPQAERTCRVRAMRAAFKTAQALGLNTGESWQMRGALAKYLMRPISSRAQLSAGEWCEVTAGLELGLIAW